ncbi:hypothetical protein cypCar_00008938 [Cyprinus carpio]|nr:hypothetical protein cypCar_00008938 [Cyprinus carpio]
MGAAHTCVLRGVTVLCAHVQMSLTADLALPSLVTFPRHLRGTSKVLKPPKNTPHRNLTRACHGSIVQMQVSISRTASRTMWCLHLGMRALISVT